MKYKNIIVTGHRRAGTHYVCALISRNFLGNDDYVKIYRNHKLPKQLMPFDKNTVYICVKRNFDDVAKSMFKMRKRFGLNENNFKRFLKRTYRDMYKDFSRAKCRYKTLKGESIEIGTGARLRFNKTVKGYYNDYYALWDKFQKNFPNILIVNYEDFKNDYNLALKSLAEKLGSDKESFIDIEEKIGWTPIN